VTVTVAPAKATNPAPSPTSFCNVTVNVCGCPTSFVAFGAIEIFAFTHVLVAGPLFAPAPFVFRVNDTPPTLTVEIRNVAAGGPGTTVLASASFAASAIPPAEAAAQQFVDAAGI